MAWYDEAVFYHIYPLGLTGAPMHNDYGAPQPRLRTLFPWIDHMAELGCNALYIGPLFESQSHGYDTTDYRKLDSRLGTNQDFKDFVAACHGRGIRVVLDGVFNHTGRDFFAFRDIQEHREDSRRHAVAHADENVSHQAAQSHTDGNAEAHVYRHPAGFGLLYRHWL